MVVVFWSLARICAGQAVVGEAAPPLSIEAVQNAEGVEPSSLNWDSLAGRTVVLEFWATWCGPCVAAIPHLNDLADGYAATDDVVFLSVTAEDEATVRSFLRRREMRSIVGHDLDKDMTRAWGVHGIPRTFLVRDGRVLASTHPTHLAKEHIETARRGEVVVALAGFEQKSDTVHLPAALAGAEGTIEALPLGRREIGASVSSGRDPYNVLDEQPSFQVIVRAPDTKAMSIVSQDSGGIAAVTMLGADTATIVSTFWGVPWYGVDVPEAIVSSRHDVIVYRGEASTELIREAVAAGLGVRVEPVIKTVPGYRLREADDGLRLLTALDHAPSGWSSGGTADAYRFRSGSAGIQDLAALVAHQLNAPVEDATAAGNTRFDIDLILPNTPDAMRTMLLEEAGLVLESAQIEMRSVRVTPRPGI
jgi:thiol-disulfide isomerase/thioredoxin